MPSITRYVKPIARLAERPCPYPEGRFGGSGIVVCGGGRTLFTCTWVLLKLLRHLGCELPVEVWHRGRREMSREMAALLEALPSVRCVDASQVERGAPRYPLRGWELKPFAITHSAFEQVLYLDCDNVPTRDPSFLLRCRPYRQHGAVFWPDRWMGDGDDPRLRTMSPDAWAACGLPPRDEPELESGQMVIHKRRCWQALQLALFLNARSDHFYRLVLGDKDTFHLAWRRVGQDYAIPSCRPRQDGPNGPVLYQHDFGGRCLFQHRNEDKWSYSGGNLRIPGFQHEALCLRYLAGLRRRWDGVVRHYPRDYTPAERQACRQLAAARLFSYESEQNHRLIELRRDFTLGVGSDEWETEWDVEETGRGSVALVLRGAMRTMCVLTPSRGAAWTGHRLHFDRGRVRLRPVSRLPAARRRAAEQVRKLLPRLARQPRECAAQVARERRFYYHRVGLGTRVLELRTDHTIGEGAEVCEQWWYVRNTARGTELVIGGAAGATCTLRPRDERCWTGRWLRHEKGPVELEPVSATVAARPSAYFATCE